MDQISAGDIGGCLRRARKQRALSLHDVADRTKLSISVVQAIERNDFESLPGGIYRKGYLRSLAEEVGLDPKEVAAEYARVFEPVVDPTVSKDSSAPATHNGAKPLIPSSSGFFVAMAIPAVLGLGWFAWPDSTAPAPLPATHAADLIPTSLLLKTATSPLRRSSAPVTEAMTSLRIVPLRIELALTDWCWVAAESDGQRGLYRLVAPGERIVVEAQRTISLRLGNAGSANLSINDGPPRVAGRDGEVVDLTLTPDNVEALRDVEVETVSGDEPWQPEVRYES